MLPKHVIIFFALFSLITLLSNFFLSYLKLKSMQPLQQYMNQSEEGQSYLIILRPGGAMDAYDCRFEFMPIVGLHGRSVP